MIGALMQNEDKACTQRYYRISRAELPLACPPLTTEVWDAHPRVYFPIEEMGKVTCPYCSATYELTE